MCNSSWNVYFCYTVNADMGGVGNAEFCKPNISQCQIYRNLWQIVVMTARGADR